uniref:Uncharacterized protein n=1 Tax=Arundo donax TaxID=35708 RepID=A0A0A9A8X2_ARUDO
MLSASKFWKEGNAQVFERSAVPDYCNR